MTRYFRYVLNIDLLLYDYETADDLCSAFLFFFNDEKHNPSLLLLFQSRSFSHFISLGFSNDADVNLMDMASLRDGLTSKFQSPYHSKPLFSREEILARITQFFYSHGEKSLFEGLSRTIYNLRNGLFMLKDGRLTAQDDYLVPGIKWWWIFTERFLCNHQYFIMLDLENEIMEIENIISSVGQFITNLESFQQSEIVNLPEQSIYNYLNMIKTIRVKLTDMAGKLGIEEK